MENIGYYNGKFDLIEKMTVPMNDRAMYFGDGVYDATYSVNRTIFALEDHLDRFYNSCRLLEIPAPMPREELKKTLYECVNKVDDPNQFVIGKPQEEPEYAITFSPTRPLISLYTQDPVR
ncbi:D-amino acid aminotransferase [human gut metagenome]|uniref:D-amino acid aminotransferase n=2 Tax=human gut metagenome TaxID=408170 RepID=K1TE27_9ZZZZ